jgi:hypothetical protein
MFEINHVLLILFVHKLHIYLWFLMRLFIYFAESCIFKHGNQYHALLYPTSYLAGWLLSSRIYHVIFSLHCYLQVWMGACIVS